MSQRRIIAILIHYNMEIFSSVRDEGFAKVSGSLKPVYPRLFSFADSQLPAACTTATITPNSSTTAAITSGI